MRFPMSNVSHASSPEADALAAIETGLLKAGGPVALASSFSAEDVAALHLALRVDSTIGVFALDTGRLPEETLRTAENLALRLGVRVRWFAPGTASLEALTLENGVYSFYESPEARKECCRVRKVEPLTRALAGLKGWITGLRREQAVTREELDTVELDHPHGGIVKINPLARWCWEDVLEYVKLNDLPLNPLYAKGFSSIGCEPCTRAVRPGEHPRAGRWWWEDPEKKECGLHIDWKGKNQNG